MPDNPSSQTMLMELIDWNSREAGIRALKELDEIETHYKKMGKWDKNREYIMGNCRQAVTMATHWAFRLHVNFNQLLD